MIFAKIDYINLLPFETFIKKYISSSQIKGTIRYKKTYPAKINVQVNKKRVNAGFISSIASQKEKSLNVGIVAQKEVLSVLVQKGAYEKDKESATSNALCKVLGLDGKVIMGDKALYFWHNNKEKKEDIIDLAKFWHEKYNLPFVFARLSYNKHGEYYKKLTHNFLQTKVKIPRYILDKYAKNTGVTPKQILSYLEKISYNIGPKEQKALRKFFILARNVNKGFK